MPTFAETLVRLVYQPTPITPLPQQYLSKHMQLLKMKSEADLRLTFEKWPVAFIDKIDLAEAGFYYADYSAVLCFAFCVEQIGLWQEGIAAFKEQQRWNQNCDFIRYLSVGNIPVGSSDLPTTSFVQPSKSRDVYGYHLE